jgi:F0F1-type ATP synthase assembly protein I
MPKRSEDSRASDEKTPQRSIAQDLARARAARFGAGGAQGLQAMSLPLVLGGCLAVGYFGGAWLDAKFGTGFWMPLGVVFGLAAGFRQTVITVRQLGAHHERERLEAQQRALAERSKSVSASQGEAATTQRPRPRIFEVPEPPMASFERREVAAKTSQSVKADDVETEDLIEELLGERPPELGGAPGNRDSEPDEK